MTIADWDLLERATAAAQNSANCHDNLYGSFEEPGDDEQPGRAPAGSPTCCGTWPNTCNPGQRAG